MPFQIVRNDIAKMTVDAIVNAANSALQMGGGVCGAIFSAAGAKQQQSECDRIGRCATGEAVVTGAYELPARFIIHAVGPIWRGGNGGEEGLLRSCYLNSLRLAVEKGCESIAFPLISSGIYGYPKHLALQVAVTAIGDFLREHDMTVYLVVFDREPSLLDEASFSSIKKYVCDHYMDDQDTGPLYRRLSQASAFPQFSVRNETDFCGAVPAPTARRSLEDVISRVEETFSEMLLRLIDEKGLTDVEVYKRANMDRKLFSKIRSNRDYKPGKPTATALAIALKLNLDETLDLLKRAGYTLSHSSKADLIVEYFIRERIFDIYQINEALFTFDQPLL